MFYATSKNSTARVATSWSRLPQTAITCYFGSSNALDMFNKHVAAWLPKSELIGLCGCLQAAYPAECVHDTAKAYGRGRAICQLLAPVWLFCASVCKPTVRICIQMCKNRPDGFITPANEVMFSPVCVDLFVCQHYSKTCQIFYEILWNGWT